MSEAMMPATAMENYVFANATAFEAAQRMAKALSSSTLVPKEYLNNMPNCLIALEVAHRLKASPLMVMQNLYIVHGRPSWSSQFVISAINTCGRFRPLRFDMIGKEDTDSRSCIAWTVEKDVEIPTNIRTIEEAKKVNLPVLESPLISIELSKKEGWYQKNGSKWQTMPELMLRYRAAGFFGRLYAPDVLMGMYTAEEAEDMKDVTPTTSTTSSTVDALNAEFLTPKVIDEPESNIEQPSIVQDSFIIPEKIPIPIKNNKAYWPAFVDVYAKAAERAITIDNLVQLRRKFATQVENLRENDPDQYKRWEAIIAQKEQELIA